MDLKNIKLRKDEDYITLGIMLKMAGIVDTGGQAKYFLMENDVFVNDELDSRRGRKLYRGDKIKVGNSLFLIV